MGKKGWLRNGSLFAQRDAKVGRLLYWASGREKRERATLSHRRQLVTPSFGTFDSLRMLSTGLQASMQFLQRRRKTGFGSFVTSESDLELEFQLPYARPEERSV